MGRKIWEFWNGRKTALGLLLVGLATLVQSQPDIAALFGTHAVQAVQVAGVIITVLGSVHKLKKGRAVAVLVFLLMACQAQASVIPKYDFTASALVVHDLASGYRHPYITITQIVLGPHYGPFYIGGAGLAEIPGVGMVIPYGTYVDPGKVFNGKFKGATVSVGKLPGSLHGTYFGLGFSR
jgi:hypothetical protein